MDTLKCIKVFTRIARLGSMAAAARELELSPPRVSKYLSCLESYLGVQLVVRNTRSLYLTETGQYCAERWEKVLYDFEATQLMIAKQKNRPAGSLKLNVPVSYGVLVMSTIIADFQRKYDDIKMSVVCSDTRVDLFEEEVDLVIRIAYKLDDSSMRARKITCCDMVMCASPDYLEQYGTPKVLKDLERRKCIIYSNLLNAEKWEGKGPEGLESVVIKNGSASNNGELVTQLALHGAGIIFQPSFIVDPHLHSGRLKRILTNYSFQPLTIYAVYPNKQHESVAVRLFIDYLAAQFAKTNDSPAN